MNQEPRTYWRTLEELAETPEFSALVEREVPRFRDIINAFDRRRFLQLMGASVALAGLSGCGPETDARNLLPYVEEPENVVPGKSRYYTSAMVQEGYASGVLVEHQMARPIKIEGNPDHPASLGAASAIMQASILELYDPRRAQTLIGDRKIVSWESVVAALDERRQSLAASHGSGLRILTGAVTSPVLQDQLDQLQQQFPEMRWHQWEPLHRDGEFAAANTSFGQPVERTFAVSRAERIFGIGSDLISTSLGWLTYARDFAAARRPFETGGIMSRVYAIESTPTLLGAKADHRLAMGPEEIAVALRYLAGLLGAGPSEWSQADIPHAAWLKAAADDLKQHNGKALVHAGREQPVEIHVLTDAINGALSAFGNTVKLIAPVEAHPSSKLQSISELADDMRSGKVDTLLILQETPAVERVDDVAETRHFAFDKG